MSTEAEENNQGQQGTGGEGDQGSNDQGQGSNDNLEGQQQQQQQDVVVNDIDEDSIKKFFAEKKGRVVENLDELFVEKEKIVEVNPYENTSDELKQILAYQKETGRGVKDYFKLQENIDDRPLVDLALEKVRNEVGGSFTPEDLTAYLEDALSIDLSGELTPAETVKLTKFVKDYKEQLKADQEKYKTPLPKNEPTTDVVEMVTLENGQKVEKSVFEAHEKERQIYLNDIRGAVNSVAASSITIEFDNNGVKENLTYGYEYDVNDKKDMLSKAEDIDQTVSKLFRTDNGFNHQEFIESTWFLDKVNREKWGAAIANKARAEAIAELTKADNNVNFQTDKIPAQQGKPGVKIVPVRELLNR